VFGSLQQLRVIARRKSDFVLGKSRSLSEVEELAKLEGNEGTKKKRSGKGKTTTFMSQV